MTEHAAEAEPHPVEPEMTRNEMEEGQKMGGSQLAIVLRILDNENRLAERADQKAISLLSVLGVFMVFFIVYYRFIPINAITVLMMTTYVAAAFFAIAHLILTIRPRIQPTESVPNNEKSGYGPDPAFFGGICCYPTFDSYQESLNALTREEGAVVRNYTRQIFSVAHINQLKYRYVRRAAVIVLSALAIELTIVAYLFALYISNGYVA
jgi:hypothetical protein